MTSLYPAVARRRGFEAETVSELAYWLETAELTVEQALVIQRAAHMAAARATQNRKELLKNILSGEVA